MTIQELEMCIYEYGKEIYSFCKHLTCSLQEADDLYQDTFLKAMELKDKIDYQDNVKSYLLSIALRIWKNRRRKFAWRKRIADVQPAAEEKETTLCISTELLPEEQILDKEKKEAVRHAVDKLPKRLCIVVLLFYMEELSVAQIASILKIPTGTVKSRLYQARKLLKKELEDILNEK